jgi:tyrosine-protein kinase Etk/Wzc
MEKAVTEGTNKHDKGNLLDYLTVLAKYARVIVITSMAVTILTYLCLFLSSNVYTSTARLLPPQTNLTLSAQLVDSLVGGALPWSAGNANVGGLGSSLLGLPSASDMYVGLLNSDTVADRIIARFHLRKLYGSKDIESARRALRRQTNINVLKGTGLIVIEVTDEVPRRAAELANAYVQELEKLMQDLTVQEAKSRLTFLDNERALANTNLTKAEDALRTFSQRYGVIQIDTQTKSVLDYIAQLRADIDAREVQIQVLRQQATPFNYDVVRLETEIKGLKEKLASAEKQMGQVCKGDVCLSTSEVPGLGLEYIRLYREVKFQENLYQTFTKLAEVARLDMARNITTISVVDRALPPEKRSNTRLLPAILTGMVTFFMMVFVSFGAEYWQNLQKSEDEAQRISIIKNYLKPGSESSKRRSLLIRLFNFLRQKHDQN